MLWIIYSLAAALCTSITYLIRKKTLIKEHSIRFLTILKFFEGIFVLLLIPFVNFELPFMVYILLFLISLIGLEADIFDTKSLRKLEISNVFPLKNLSPLFLVIISYIFLGEKLVLLQIIGIIILIFGTYVLECNGNLLNYEYFFKRVKHSRYLQYAFLSLVLVSFSAIGEKYAFNKHMIDPITILFFVYAFMAIEMLIIQIFFPKDKEHKNSIKELFDTLNRARWPIFISALFGLLAAAFYYLAIQIALVSLVIPIKRLSTLITTVLGGGFFKEKHLLFRTLACIIMLIGLYLIVHPML
ncbi:MAG: EamA family transporter [Candidatus Nanoarchaeia archaeon]|nr:EamA family transporter [Candidatus Nanoarchaeia archaeon]MDD5587536.1 EamA family transporter [Candidatus Nanoarchaeia archaeon]